MKFTAEVTRETRKAICCHLQGDNVDHWIPHSQIRPGSTVQHVCDVGTLILSDWFVRTARLPIRDESIEY